MSLEVLIADQDVELAMLYRRFLHSHGLSAETVTGGLECLRRIRQRPPDVLVLDCGLLWGGADGVVACLREEGASLPVILTTWSTSPEEVCRLVVPPVVHCIRKFFPLPALLKSIRLALGATAS
jgi:DNA-binding response OmpR family regulator